MKIKPMKTIPPPTGFHPSVAKCATVCALMLAGVTLNLSASVILEADFNGTGTGTGGTNDLVSIGGTGSIYQYTTATTSVQSSSTMGQGSYLNVSVAGTPTPGALGGVNITPTSDTSSWAALNTVASGTTSLHGAADCFIRTNNAGTGGFGQPNWLYLLDLGNVSDGGLSLVLNAQWGNTLTLIIKGGANSFLTGNDYTTQSEYVMASADINWQASTIYHIGLSLNTGVDGVTTAKIYLTEGDGAIDLSTNTSVIGSTSFKIDSSVVTKGLPTGAFDFNAGGWANGGEGKSVDMDAFRLYDAVPTTFTAVPEPTSLSFLGAAAFAGLLGRRLVKSKASLRK